MTKTVDDYMKTTRNIINQSLLTSIEDLHITNDLKKSMSYSFDAGGKRLRPALLLAVLEALGKDKTIGLSAACALEMVHTYSLIHDDLPAMDDDDLRRGKPTNHMVFGEATAILAGDALLTFAFEYFVTNLPSTIDASTGLVLVQKLAQAAGPSGMVGGQSDDLQAEGRELNLEELESVHLRKTGQLLKFAVESGALIGGANDQQIHALNRYAHHLGLAFQIRDDILDIEGDEGQLGKRVGSDMNNNKNTYPKLLGMDGAKDMLNSHYAEALNHLEEANLRDDSILRGLTDYILQRNK